MASRAQALQRFAKDAEDAASGLHSFRDNLPRSATEITGIIGALFAVSSDLRQIHNAHGNRRLVAHFPRIDYDLAHAFRTMKFTLEAIFGMFGSTRAASHQAVWEDLNVCMEVDEGMGLLDRLDQYHDYLGNLSEVLAGRRPNVSRELRAQILRLTDAQQSALRRERRASMPLDPGANAAPRPPSRRDSIHRPTAIETHISGDWFDSYPAAHPPFAPEPPMPMSPSYTSASSDTYYSSQQSSYFSDSQSSQQRHWALHVFDGHHPHSQYRLQSPTDYSSTCTGTVEQSAITKLARDGFQQVLEVPFDEGQLRVWLYWRPHDQRARMLVMTVNARGESFYYCQPLTTLKVMRNGSTLQFCRVHRGSRLILWARLNFVFHERMVLFYSTFVAMKRQDPALSTHDFFVDHHELLRDNDSHGDHEEEVFAGEMRHGGMRHALRIFQDLPSRVVRLEACALRGPLKDVPIWTAFITKYAKNGDVAWAEHDSRTESVSLAALKPRPSVFTHGGYQPPRDSAGNYLLPFTSREDASGFLEMWTQLCRSYGRH